MSTNLTIRLDSALKETLDRLAKASGRSRAYLAQEALRRSVDQEGWQIAEINNAVEEADAADFVPDSDVAATLKRWNVNAG